MRSFRVLGLSGLAFVVCMFLAGCGGGGTKPTTPPSPPTITSSTLATGAVNVAYDEFMAANGGTSPYTWTISGTLPPGLAQVSNTAEIKGTPTAYGVYSFSATVTDLNNLSATGTISVSIEGVILINCTSCVSGTLTLPSGSAGMPYSATLSASGGKAPYSWCVIETSGTCDNGSGGALPAGLTISSDSNGNGIISGTPTTPGAPMTFTVQATDSEATPSNGSTSLTLSIMGITTTSLPNGTQNSPYSGVVTATGGEANYTWSVVSGSLPPGLSIANSSCQSSRTPSCTISGTPTQLGVSNFTLKVSDGETPPATATAALSIDVQGPKLEITTTSLPQGTVNLPYSAAVQASGGILPLTWCVVETGGNCDNGSGTLPAGLTMDTSGNISGTPTASGKTYFQVEVKDNENPPQIVYSPPAGSVNELYITINPALNNGNLTGHYAFSFNGYQNGSPVLMAGAVVADGHGNLTQGALDVNDGSGETIDGSGNVVPQTLTTGSVYSINPDGTGTMTLLTAQGSYNFAIVISGNACTAATTSALCGKMIQSDSSAPASYGSGTIRAQDSTAFSSSVFFPGNFATRLAGTDAQGNRYAAAGAFGTAASNRTAIDCNGNGWGLPNGCPADVNDAGTAASATFLGTFATIVDPNTGRGGFVSLTFNGDSGDVFTYAYYVISKSEMILISADPVSKPANLTLWSVVRQIPSTTGWALSSLKGTSVIELQGQASVNGNPVPDLTAGLLTMDGAGNGTLSSDENQGGTTNLQQSSSGTYTVDGHTGRAPLSGFATQFGSTPAVLYLYAPNAGFVLGTDPETTFGSFQSQITATYTNLSVNGNYAGGSSWPVTTNIVNSVEAMFANGQGSISATQYTSGPGGPTGPNALSLTYQVDATGRAVVNQNGTQYGILYVISPTQVVLLPVTNNGSLSDFSSGPAGGSTN